MHEHGIADSILDRILEQMRLQGADRVLSTTITVGELSGISPDALIHGIHHCCEHEQIQPFDIEVITQDTTLRCEDCGREQVLDDTMSCSHCGSDNVSVKPNTGVSITEIRLDVSR